MFELGADQHETLHLHLLISILVLQSHKMVPAYFLKLKVAALSITLKWVSMAKGHTLGHEEGGGINSSLLSNCLL